MRVIKVVAIVAIEVYKDWRSRTSQPGIRSALRRDAYDNKVMATQEADLHYFGNASDFGNTSLAHE